MKSFINREPPSATTNLAPPETLRQRAQRLGQNWKIVNDLCLEKEFKFPDFCHAMEFTRRVGEIAEEENHHPDIYLSYGLVRIHISTHESNSLTAEDFNLAARIDQMDAA